MQLLSPAHYNTKTAKTSKGHLDFRIVTLSLAPAKSSGHQVCPNATESCTDACVGGVNVGLSSIFPKIREARERKTRYFFEHRAEAIAQLVAELEKEQASADDNGQVMAVRLNCFSDLRWESSAWGQVPQRFPRALFYDYSKEYGRAGSLPANYHVCWSWTEREEDQADCVRLLLEGWNVAVVFATEGSFAGNAALRQGLPKRWRAPSGDLFEVHDGDRSDLRIVMPGLDPGPSRSGRGKVIGLRLKAANSASRERAMESGFAVMTGMVGVR
jgi:hypothetical protein